MRVEAQSAPTRLAASRLMPMGIKQLDQVRALGADAFSSSWAEQQSPKLAFVVVL